MYQFYYIIHNTYIILCRFEVFLSRVDCVDCSLDGNHYNAVGGCFSAAQRSGTSDQPHEGYRAVRQHHRRIGTMAEEQHLPEN